VAHLPIYQPQVCLIELGAPRSRTITQKRIRHRAIAELPASCSPCTGLAGQISAARDVYSNALGLGDLSGATLVD